MVTESFIREIFIFVCMNEDKDTDGQSYPGIEETDRLAGSLDSVADESQYELVEERCRDYEFNGDVVAHLVVSKNPKGSYRSAFSTLRSLDTLLRMAHSLTIEQRLAMQKEEPGLYRALSFYHLEPTSQDVIPDESKPFSKIYNKNKKELLLSDYSSLETKKLHAAAQIAQEGANKEIDDYLSKFSFPSEESKKLTKKYETWISYC